MAQLHVRSLGKAYKRYRLKSGRFREWLGAASQHELRWVLRDVSFDVEPGDAVGIIGANGAGKSTLLKLVAGTTMPTAGSVQVTGALSAVLELGIGFHPEFTGRQNVYMAGSLRGMNAARIRELIDGIREFAEIGDYFDQPLRTYSSGMQMRLAFSVATAVRPDILIIDEALSVGDAYFSHKSFERIREFRDQGTTLLFVSHSPDAVKTLCNRAILLDAGQLVHDGMPDAVLDYYNAMIAVREADTAIRQTEREGGGWTTRSGSNAAVVDKVELLCGGNPVRALRSGDAAVVRLDIAASAPLEELTAGILIRDRLGNDVFGTNTYYCNAPMSGVRPGDRLSVEFRFEALRLGLGSFSLTTALHSKGSHIAGNHDWWDRALVFQVVEGDGPTGVGVCRMPLEVAWLGSPAGPGHEMKGSNVESTPH